MQDKFNLTKEQNIFLAKKALVVSIYNSIRLEGINTTYSDTKTILEGVNVPNLKLDEINCILNLRDAWNYVLSHIDDPLNLDFICQINAYVSRNESLEWGVLRTGKIGINGVDYVPPIPNRNDFKRRKYNKQKYSFDALFNACTSFFGMVINEQVWL